MPLTGFIQTLIAVKTFWFLPKADEKVQGYYDEKKAMSYVRSPTKSISLAVLDS